MNHGRWPKDTELPRKALCRWNGAAKWSSSAMIGPAPVRRGPTGERNGEEGRRWYGHARDSSAAEHSSPNCADSEAAPS